MIYNKSKKIMWTEITITIFWTDNSNQDIENIFAIFYSLELEFSRFLWDSSLSKLNIHRKLEVSDIFIDVLKKSKQIYTDTNWYFNPLINLKQLWYSSDFYINNFKQEDTDTEVNLDFDKLEIIWNKVSLQPWQNLDLWGIVKWCAVDIAKEYLDNKWYKNYIVDAWGDIFTSWSNENWWKIIVGIDSPFIKDQIFATLELENKAIATSGIYKRKWNIDLGPNNGNKEFNHIINPISWINNNEIISITLISDHCYLVDWYATACIAMWKQQTLNFLDKNNIDWIIICTDQTIHITDWMKKYNINTLI